MNRLPPHLAAAVCVCKSLHGTPPTAQSSSTHTQNSSSQDPLGSSLEYLNLQANDAGELILDDTEYARRKLEWVQRYTRVETLRERFGTNRNVLWGDLGPSETRKLYHTLLPQALVGLYDGGLMRPHELAPLAYEARKAAKKYARERSILPVRMAAMAFDGYRSCRDYGIWSHHGLSWNQVWQKYEKRIEREFDFSNGEDDDSRGVEITKQICLRILESSCRTNVAVNQLVLGEEGARARRCTLEQQKMEMAAIAAQLDSDIQDLLVEGAQKSAFYHPTLEQQRKQTRATRRRVSVLVNKLQPEPPNYVFEGKEQTGLTEQEYFLLRIMTGDKIGSVRVQDLLEWMREEEGDTTVHSRHGPPEGTPEDQRLRRAKKARVALQVGRMYASMGMSRNCVAVYEEALLLWKSTERDDRIDSTHGLRLLGRLTEEEVDALHESDIYFIIQLYIEQSKVYATTVINEKHPSYDSVFRCITEAWVIYKHFASQDKIRDRSIVFPLFSSLFMYCKTGYVDFPDSSIREFVTYYLEEAKLHGDPVHYARALAMQAETDAQHDEFESALEWFYKIIPMYEPSKHSALICKAYGTDRVAQCFSIAATWEMLLDKKQSALDRCEFVIRELLPKMDPKNVHNNFCLLYPVIRILKDHEAARMKSLFEEHVVAKFDEYFSAEDAVTPCLIIFKPLSLLLELYIDEAKFAWRDDVGEVIEWAATECNGVAPDILDAAVMNFGWNFHTITAELCLRLSKIAVDEQVKGKLLSKAHDLCIDARANHQKIKYPFAFQENERILAELDSYPHCHGQCQRSVMQDPLVAD